jgi:phage-related protein
MPANLPLPEYITQGASRKKTYRVLKAQFGDGYSSTAPDGINNKVDSWQSITYQFLTPSERDLVWDTLDAVGASDYFTWTPPGYPPGTYKWKLTDDGVSETPASGEHYSISFELTQVF